MGPSNLNRIIGYSISAVTLAIGILVLSGQFFPEGTPTQLRVVFGIVLILLSIYRAIVTTTRQIHARRNPEE